MASHASFGLLAGPSARENRASQVYQVSQKKSERYVNQNVGAGVNVCSIRAETSDAGLHDPGPGSVNELDSGVALDTLCQTSGNARSGRAVM